MKYIPRKYQKYRAQALKKYDTENFPDELFRLLNRPPAKNVLTIIPINITKKNPEKKYEARLFRKGPRSLITSISNPSSSLSVIMLFPKPALTIPFIGITKSDISKREKNHIINTPFQDLNDRTAPDDKDLRIFITY
ncbi:MAG: hypothetical protein A2V64_05960 [Bacteroidetes bacterium RBG_13_43_22]|nr:MAG: hypothetical protein A2V64_05960 [Bacteroidetes bacterium RBG_13_43_22]